ncbi:GNAT family N-acetyltransferase [Globicatella sulfidifaciens]|uniref:GNAT family N-acetyltransferase n=1 Tax=Globicatella sulfidifaciens TaxID=136093 RepID=UPI0028923C4E|nr:GNAT family N-acetyltransferase [Globicatella sulfidifaciens]MDT2767532.1 GNAT family N-acetyltransferase [Globicatella sulfidifaciens]
MTLKLIKISKEYQQALGEMIEEWKLDQELNNTNHSPSAIFRRDYHNFEDYIQHLEQKEENNGRVPDSVYFLLDETNERLLGAINIRHYLTNELLQSGGHIGVGIRPSERRKGYATKMIGLALEGCRKLGIERVLMTCDKSNIGSAKSIQNNGGILENEFINEDGELEQRYWIELE